VKADRTTALKAVKETICVMGRNDERRPPREAAYQF
jgi:hypothetical protein